MGEMYELLSEAIWVYKRKTIHIRSCHYDREPETMQRRDGYVVFTDTYDPILHERLV